MAIGPNEIKRFDEAEVNEIEIHIDAKLKISFLDQEEIRIPLPRNLDTPTRKEIQKRYHAAGWTKVKFEDFYGVQWDPCDDHYIILGR